MAARVGVAFSDQLMLHRSPDRSHEERPARLGAICNTLRERGLWDALQALPLRPASDEELLKVHSKAYLRKLQRLDTKCKSALRGAGSDQNCRVICEDFMLSAEDVFVNEHTVECARLAAGGAADAVRSVISGHVDRALALVRPPGHHAEAHCAQGFCVLNNVAVAAHAALDAGLDRVLIVDWDVHHGNGTQRAFLDDGRVMYASVHRHDGGGFYPCGALASATCVGRGDGAGANLNVAWRGGGHGDAEYAAAWARVVLPVARAFDPQIVIVSAGFDAAQGDRMGDCSVSPEGFGALARQLLALADGKMVMVLEGGYHLRSLADSVAECTRALLDLNALSTEHQKTWAQLLAQRVKPEAAEAIQDTVDALRPHWPSALKSPSPSSLSAAAVLAVHAAGAAAPEDEEDSDDAGVLVKNMTRAAVSA